MDISRQCFCTSQLGDFLLVEVKLSFSHSLYATLFEVYFNASLAIVLPG